MKNHDEECKLSDDHPCTCRPTDPAPAMCDYDDCDQDVDVTFKDGTGMCRFHAIDSLLSQATLDEVRMIRNIFEKQWRDA